MRLFFALWPDADTQDRWYHDVFPLTAPLGGRRIAAHNLHLTLAFLGEQPGDRLNALLRLGDDLPREAMTLRFNTLQCWKKSGIACLRPSETPAALARLVGQLQTGLQMMGVAPEARDFKPHVTLRRQVERVEPALPLWPVPEWRVPRFALVRSRLTPEGADYAVLHTWELPVAEAGGNNKN